MNIHILQCGNIRVSKTVPFGNRIVLRDTARQLMTADKDRMTLIPYDKPEAQGYGEYLPLFDEEMHS